MTAAWAPGRSRARLAGAAAALLLPLCGCAAWLCPRGGAASTAAQALGARWEGSRSGLRGSAPAAAVVAAAPVQRWPALRAGKTGGEFDSGEFDFGKFEVPEGGVSIADSEELEEGPELAPPEAEVFLERETGVFECTNCGYEYNPNWGGGTAGPGTAFKDLPTNWRCPDCKVSKDRFKPQTEQVAGFADNQDFGFGFNTLTAGQKGIAIWGGLALGFLALLSGYLLD